MNKVFFKGDSGLILSAQLKSFTSATLHDGAELLKKIMEEEYIIVKAAIPRCMYTKNEKEE